MQKRYASSSPHTLDLRFCAQLANVDGLQGLARLAALQTLTLHLNGCAQLANVDGLQGLAGLAALQTLELYLYGCSKLGDKLRRNFTSKVEFFRALGLRELAK